MGGHGGAEAGDLHAAAWEDRIDLFEQLLHILGRGGVLHDHLLHARKILDKREQPLDRLGARARALVGHNLTLVKDHQRLDALHRAKHRPGDRQATARLQMLHRVHEEGRVRVADHRVNHAAHLIRGGARTHGVGGRKHHRAHARRGRLTIDQLYLRGAGGQARACEGRVGVDIAEPRAKMDRADMINIADQPAIHLLDHRRRGRGNVETRAARGDQLVQLIVGDINTDAIDLLAYVGDQGHHLDPKLTCEVGWEISGSVCNNFNLRHARACYVCQRLHDMVYFRGASKEITGMGV